MTFRAIASAGVPASGTLAWPFSMAASWKKLSRSPPGCSPALRNRDAMNSAATFMPGDGVNRPSSTFDARKERSPLNSDGRIVRFKRITERGSGAGHALGTAEYETAQTKKKKKG